MHSCSLLSNSLSSTHRFALSVRERAEGYKDRGNVYSERIIM